jgi:hypothetical protein
VVGDAEVGDIVQLAARADQLEPVLLQLNLASNDANSCSHWRALHSRGRGSWSCDVDDGVVLLRTWMGGPHSERGLPARAWPPVPGPPRKPLSRRRTACRLLAGRWAPNLALTAPTGATSVGQLLRPARGVLLDLTAAGTFASTGQRWNDRIDTLTAHCPNPPAAALLIRPDGYVAWAGSPNAQDNDALRHALTTWFGAPAGG